MVPKIFRFLSQHKFGDMRRLCLEDIEANEPHRHEEEEYTCKRCRLSKVVPAGDLKSLPVWGCPGSA